ncbi:MAG TPA: phosphodiester glycosidase family protein [Fimbriimonadaceae bacterium]|nr:phosphodiester glycosidase family protein [Fimbriimonadaceae bacterium]
MNRLITLLLIAHAASVAAGQTWEKLIAPGVTYRMELDSGAPRMIHAVRVLPDMHPVSTLPELAQGRVFATDPTKGRETVSRMAARTGAVVTINADFFPFSGDPVGLMIRDSELISLPFKNRSVAVWGKQGISFGSVETKATITAEGGDELVLNGLNQECGINEITLFTEVSGQAMCKHPNRLYAVLKPRENARLTANGQLDAVVDFLLEGTESVPIQPGNILLAANGTKTPWLASLRPGQRLTVRARSVGMDLGKVEHAIAGGPTLVRDGKPVTDWSFQGFGDSFANRRHPRTAIGRGPNGEIWLVAVDGRQKLSDGATLGELATIMLNLGCTDAINLDGGGSTTLNLLGLTVNRPSEQTERAVANGIVVMSTLPAVEDSPFVIAAPEQVVSGDVMTLEVRRPDGVVLQNSEVLWAALGKGWIDQGGRLRSSDPGTIVVQAFVRGQVVTKQIEVVAKR